MLIEEPLTSSKITVRNYQKTDLPYLTAMQFDEQNGKYMSDPTTIVTWIRNYVELR